MNGAATSASGSKISEYALLCLLALIWGSSYLLIKVGVSSIPPVTLIAVRVSIAAAFLFVVMKARGESLPRDAQNWKKLFVQSVLNSTGAWLVLAWGQQFVDSGLASVLNSTSPIFVFFITLFFTRHESSSWLKLAGACLGVLGVVLIVGSDALAGLGTQVIAQLAVLSGAIMYAGAAINGKNLSHLSVTATATGTMIWASVCLVPASLLIDRPWTLHPEAKSIIAAVVLGLVSTGFALLIYFRLLRTIGSIGTSSQAYLRAGIGVMLGLIFLGEHISPSMALGIAAAIAGVAAINFPSRR